MNGCFLSLYVLEKMGSAQARINSGGKLAESRKGYEFSVARRRQPSSLPMSWGEEATDQNLVKPFDLNTLAPLIPIHCELNGLIV